MRLKKLFNQTFNKKKKFDEIEFLLLSNNIKLSFNVIHFSLYPKMKHLEKLLEETISKDFLNENEFNILNEQYKEISEESKTIFNKIDSTKINMNMILVEVKNYLNTTKLFPKDLLFKAQDLENNITEFKTLKKVSLEKLHVYEEHFSDFKTYFEETKETYHLIKSVLETTSDAHLRNDFIILFQQSNFSKIKDLIELENKKNSL